MSFAAGMAVGFGAGMGSGIAVGTSVGKKQAREQIIEYARKNNISITDHNGRKISPTDLLDKACSCSGGANKNLMLIFLALGILALAGGVVFFFVR